MKAETEAARQKRELVAGAVETANEIRADREFAERFRKGVAVLTALMNEAMDRNLVIGFNINLMEDTSQSPPRKVYVESVSIVKAV